MSVKRYIMRPCLDQPWDDYFLSNSPCLWASSRTSPVVMPLPDYIVCTYLACVCMLYMVCYIKKCGTTHVNFLHKGTHWLHEWTSASGRVYTEVADTFSCYLQEESYEKVENNVLYNVHEFQTWSNDLKRRGPAGLRDLPCFPYLPLPSSQCPKKHLNSHLLWKRLDRTALAPASCAAGRSFVRSPLRRNH